MAEAVGTLRVDVVARTSKFNAGLDKAGKKVSWFGSRVALARKKFNAFATSSLVGAIGLGALVIAVKRSAESIDKLGKTSSKLGIPVEKLQELRFAAKQSGIEINTFDMAMQRMTRRVSEAAIGTGEAQGAIKELGLDAKELGELTPDQMLNRVADAMRNVKSPSDRLRLAFKLFDSEGAALVNMLDAGSAGLRAFGDEARATGSILSEEMVNDVERATNAVGRLTTTLKGGLDTLTVFGAQGLNFASELPLRIEIGRLELERKLDIALGNSTTVVDRKLKDMLDALDRFRNGPDLGAGGAGGLDALATPARRAPRFTPPAALEQHTAAAFSAILKAGRAGGKKSKLEEIGEKQLLEAVAQGKVLDLIAERVNQQQLKEARL